MRILDIRHLPEGAASLFKVVQLGEYRAWINEDRRHLTPELFEPLDACGFDDVEAQERRIAAFLSQTQIRITRHAHKGDKEIDLRPFIQDIRFLPESQQVSMHLRLGSQGQARPSEIIEALYGVPAACFRFSRHELVEGNATPRAVAAQPQVTA